MTRAPASRSRLAFVRLGGGRGLASRASSEVGGNYDAGSVTLQHDRQRNPSLGYSPKGRKARIARRKQGLQSRPCRNICSVKNDLDGRRNSINPFHLALARILKIWL